MRRRAILTALVAAGACSASAALAKVDGRFELTPTAREVSMYYPVHAMGLGWEGQAVLNCVVQPDSTLGNCAVVSETPGGLGFGAASLHLSRLYRLKPGVQAAGDHVQFPLLFRLAAGRRR